MKTLNFTIIGCIAVMSLFSPKCFSGNEGSGGGDGIVCFKNSKDFSLVKKRILDNRKNDTNFDVLNKIDFSKLSVESFDLKSLVHDQEAQTPDTDAVKWVQKRLELFSEKTKFADTLIKSNNKFPFSTWISSQSGLKDIDDANEQINLPNQCLLMQLAVQTSTGVYFDNRLVKKLDTLNLSSLIMHEAVYRITISYGATNSEITRALTAFLMSKQLETNGGVDVTQKLVNWNLKPQDQATWPAYSEEHKLKNNEKVLVYAMNIFNDIYSENYNCTNFHEKNWEDCFIWKNVKVQGLPLKADHLVEINLQGEVVGGVAYEDFQLNHMNAPKDSLFVISSEVPWTGFVYYDTGPAWDYRYEAILQTTTEKIHMKCLTGIEPGSFDQTDPQTPSSFSCTLIEPMTIFDVPLNGNSDGHRSFLGYNFETNTYGGYLSRDVGQKYKAGDYVEFDKSGIIRKIDL